MALNRCSVISLSIVLGLTAGLFAQEAPSKRTEESGKGTSHSTGSKPADGRMYWVSSDKEGIAELRMMMPGAWVETCHDGQHGRNYWIEVVRLPEYVELYDKRRSLGMRLSHDNGIAVQDYKRNGPNQFVPWRKGAWVMEPADVVYLSDLPETSHKVLENKKIPRFGWGKAGKMLGKNQMEQIYLDDRPSPKGIYTHPPTDDFASVKFQVGALNRHFFRARFGIADGRGSDSFPLTFVVIGDGKMLFTSTPVTLRYSSQECEVNIRDVKELELRVNCRGNAQMAYAVWYEPRLSSE